MASPTIRSTYALDPETVERLTQLARQWKLSRSATLRKLIREADAPVHDNRIQAWQRLRSSVSAEQAAAWREEIRQERLARDRKLRRLWQAR